MTIRRRAIGMRARAFAARIASRYGRVHGFDAPMARLFARHAPVMRHTNRERHQHTHLRVSPWIALSLTHVSRSHETVGASRALATALVTRHTSHLVRTERTSRELVERVVARAVRHERQRTSAPDRVGVVTPVPRVLRKAAPIVEREEKPAPHITPAAPPAVRASLTSLEVTQLTDTVIRSLDRRLSAARERRGQS